MNIRKESYGEKKWSLVDLLGIYLSERAINRHIKDFILKLPQAQILDLGCGYHARMLIRLAPQIAKGVGIDVSISEGIKSIPNLEFIEQPIEKALIHFPDRSFDLILMISVLEHLNNADFTLAECHRILRTNGLLIINVPTWLGKYFLETSAFKFHLSPEIEMNEHKMYYNVRDLWPLLIKAGFKPHSIKMNYHKLGLNLFSVCKKGTNPV